MAANKAEPDFDGLKFGIELIKKSVPQDELLGHLEIRALTNVAKALKDLCTVSQEVRVSN